VHSKNVKNANSTAPELTFLAGGGGMGDLIRAHDWAGTSLGPPDTWPQSLKIAIRIMLSSRYAMWMAWGPNLIFFCNDAYRPTLGEKTGWLGARSDSVWAEIWPDIGPRIERVLNTGEATWDEGLLLFLERRGFAEETYHTFSYSPLADDDGMITGMLCVVTEDTKRVIDERRLRVLRDLGLRLTDIRTSQEVWSAVEACLKTEAQDLPFALAYRTADAGATAILELACGISREHWAAPASIPLAGESSWPLRDVQGYSLRVETLSAKYGKLPAGPWDKPPVEALLLPISAQGHADPIGTFIAGLNPYRPLDADYRGFLTLFVGQIAAALASANAYAAEHARAEALAQVDKAKTAFFSNISHEFRTPLTLMIGPLEDAINTLTPQDAAQRELLSVAHRSSLRLLRLVNALLDFSRIEAGRMNARYLATDLVAMTLDIAASFRSAIERAGLRYDVQCGPLSKPVWVDHDMWEKIVLNLLSNAFKFTFQGGIDVSLQEIDGAVRLSVRDTGTGIPPAELPRLFERFHRVEGAKGRSFEGSGIGLALVQELTALHAGRITVESELGYGSTFSVVLPYGCAHLPAERVSQDTEAVRKSVRADAYVEEALGWLPIHAEEGPAAAYSRGEDPLEITAGVAGPRNAGRVLVADDNADLRAYISRLLAEQGYEVEAVPNGRAALNALHVALPDILVTDVMMPELDGIGLVREIRADAALRELPVIMLSARAGEEAKIEGLAAAADDYLTKPFSARELVARVAADVANARIRREAAESIRAAQAALAEANETLEQRVAERTSALQLSEARLRAIFETSFQLQGLLAPDGTLLDSNTTALEVIDSSREDVLGKPYWDTPWFTGTAQMSEWVRDAIIKVAAGDTVRGEIALNVPAGLRNFDFSLRAIYDDAGGILALVPEAVDITERRHAEEQLRQAQKIEALGRLTGGVAHDFNNLLMVISGGLQLMERGIEGPKRQRMVEGMRQAVERGAGLCRQLLAFSRRQPLRPEVLDISKRIGEMRELLERSLRGDIYVRTAFAEGLWTVEVDPGELELVILNLAVNARDAMPNGGGIVISARNISNGPGAAYPGDFVCIAINDSGVGMSASVMARAFEPFFTTKEVGKGSGLGLAQTHGFVRASGGYVEIDSTLNVGTTISLFLPRSLKFVEAPDRALGQAATDAAANVAGGCVLLVEDDDEVAALTGEMLQQLGYEVLRVASAAAALGALANGRAVDIVFSDVMMPGTMNGISLAQEIHKRRPGLPVLLATGYAEPEALATGVPHTRVLLKPYTIEDLSAVLAAAERKIAS
jgi:PAS domain S-box-containing protein